MSEDRTITLGSRVLPVAALPLGQLRRLIPAFNRVGQAFTLGKFEEATFDDLFELLSVATGVPAAELEATPGSYRQLLDAVDTIADVCGLKPKEGDGLGEARPGTASPA